MNIKVCTNLQCASYAHFVYTVAMRCVLCRCDLAPATINRQPVSAHTARPNPAR
jgi:hypothetical protein